MITFSDDEVTQDPLAKEVIRLCDEPNDFQFCYPDEYSLKEKINAIATKIYGADGVDYTPEAEKELANLEKNRLWLKFLFVWLKLNIH